MEQTLKLFATLAHLGMFAKKYWEINPDRKVVIHSKGILSADSELK